MVTGIGEAAGVQRGLPAQVDRSEIVRAARGLAAERSSQYARSGAPISPDPLLTGNAVPGATPLRWLQGHNKCNQFVGDVLYRAGFAMPKFRMEDGSHHYVHAAALRRRTEHFAAVTDRRAVEPGDLIVIQRPGSGENSAHVEIVIGSHGYDGALVTLGAHPHGVEQRVRRLVGASASDGGWERGEARWYILRPIAVR